MCVCMKPRTSVGCVCGRERERERTQVLVCVWGREREKARTSVGGVWGGEKARMNECVCVSERERENHSEGGVCVCAWDNKCWGDVSV